MGADMYWDAVYRRGLFSGPEGPMVNFDEDGAMVLTWIKAERRLTVSVSAAKVQLLTSWGENIHEDMELADLTDTNQLSVAWEWLHANETE